MKLIIFGPPGSGKGTYSAGIVRKLGIVKISTGDMFREIAKENTEFGKKVAKILNSGKLVSDEITTEILKKKLSKTKDFILDGYPRTIEQAKALEKITKIDAIINIIAPEEILIEKISARRICSNPKCDGNFNIADIKKTIKGIDYILPPIMPKVKDKCDKCGSKLYQRSDDRVGVIKERLNVYRKQSEPVIKYYKKMPFVNIHMNRPPEVIVDRILKELKKLNLK